MKFNQIFLGLLVIMATAFLNSCVPEDSCKSCEVVTYKTGTSNVIDRQDPIEFCGNDLFAKENAAPVISGTDSIVWECY
ncbi:MAG: hypothetical protein AUJ98_02470 [Bacteroidetes bacterium CG2_30_33_31]|nr:MAG: hypothetical protein AUJ98_02470 [Bacteroidetes bacterium CG2_30_33_31]